MSDGKCQQAKNEARALHPVTPEMAKAGAGILASWEAGSLDAALDSCEALEGPYLKLARLVFQAMLDANHATF